MNRQTNILAFTKSGRVDRGADRGVEGGVREDCPYLSSILIYFDGGKLFLQIFMCFTHTPSAVKSL